MRQQCLLFSKLVFPTKGFTKKLFCCKKKNSDKVVSKWKIPQQVEDHFPLCSCQGCPISQTLKASQKLTCLLQLTFHCIPPSTDISQEHLNNFFFFLHHTFIDNISYLMTFLHISFFNYINSSSLYALQKTSKIGFSCPWTETIHHTSWTAFWSVSMPQCPYVFILQVSISNSPL